MKFSLAVLMSQHHESARTVFRQAVEQVQLAEALGFEMVWITEQHFNAFGICPDPLTFLSHLAGVTTRIRLGSGVVLLPLHNPLVIAERAALVDQLSNGRLELGIGKNNPRQRFDLFGITLDENDARFYEAHELLIKAWTSESFDFEGQFNRAENVKMSIRPLQHPHPPVWVATFGNPDAINFAAQRGYPLLQAASGDGLTRNINLYCDAYQDEISPCLNVMRAIYVKPDGQQARAEMHDPARWYIEHNPGRPAKIPNMELAIFEFINTLGIIGSTEECITRIRDLKDNYQINNLTCVFGPGGIPHESILESMRLFADKILPEFSETIDIS